ncbi:MAG: RNA-binding protein [Terriglobia bacterium]|jgi:RNA recognition motif-containing protein|nr:RNA-binding protein [Terriglobia bacterium]
MKKIFVGNFNFNMSEAELRSLFEPFGKVESVSVATDGDTGRVRGFGFVDMLNDEEAEKAMSALNGKDVGGRTLNVNEAGAKNEFSRLRGSGRDQFRGHGR